MPIKNGNVTYLAILIPVIFLYKLHTLVQKQYNLLTIVVKNFDNI